MIVVAASQSLMRQQDAGASDLILECSRQRDDNQSVEQSSPLYAIEKERDNKIVLLCND